MRRKLMRACFLAALGGGLALGCESTRPGHPYPVDPLLLSKKPLEGKLESGEPTLIVLAEPSAPPLPPMALAARPVVAPSIPKHQLATVPRAEPRGGGVPAQTMSSPVLPVPAAPAVRSRPSANVEATPAVRRQMPGSYGHAADYTWLQGVLDRHYHGHLDLRYCDPSTEDTWGGKVCLEGDPRLAQFKEGDVIYVEGEIVQDHEHDKQENRHHYPHYRIREMRLVQRAN